MERIARRLGCVVLLAAVVVLVSGGTQSAAQTVDSPVRLAVVVLRGWNTSAGDGTFASITPALERVGTAPEVNTAISVEDFSYGYPDMTYGLCATNQTVEASAGRLEAQVQDIVRNHPNARLMLVGHSLGGVIALRWAAVEGTPALVGRTAAIVTLDSPLQGTANIPGEIADLVNAWLSAQLCGERRVIEQLAAGATGGPLATLSGAVDRLGQSGGRVYSGASRGDIPIAAQSAQIAGAEVRLFDSGVCPDWTALATSTPGLTTDVRTTDWGRVRAQINMLPASTQRAFIDRLSGCLQTSHGNVLRDPAVARWLVELTEAILAVAPASAPTATPTLGVP